MSERVDILGAGLSGLSAATILARNGYDVHVHEIRKDSGARFDGDFQGIENWTSDTDFFDEMREGGHRIFFLSDFTADLADVPKSKLGIVEQIICAGGRIFFGTGHSTFSSFIYRLRGYMGAPVKGEYHLHNKYTKENVAVNDVPGAPGATFDAMDNYHEPSLLWTELN